MIVNLVLKFIGYATVIIGAIVAAIGFSEPVMLGIGLAIMFSSIGVFVCSAIISLLTEIRDILRSAS